MYLSFPVETNESYESYGHLTLGEQRDHIDNTMYNLHWK